MYVSLFTKLKKYIYEDLKKNKEKSRRFMGFIIRYKLDNQRYEKNIVIIRYKKKREYKDIKKYKNYLYRILIIEDIYIYKS